MTILTLDWNEGRPEKLQAGMVVDDKTFGLVLIGGANEWYSPDAGGHMWEGHIKAWAWLIKPHELEWIGSMRKQHVKGRPDQ